MSHKENFRVYYSEVDKMGTFYNSHALVWFEKGRTEYIRAKGVSYREIEERGIMLPVVEAHLEFKNPAMYDDELTMTTTSAMVGKVRIRFDVEIANADTGKVIVKGHTIHALLGPDGKLVRAPEWFVDLLDATDEE